ncbi:MAG TPA: hypothetical protein VFJ58_26800 [Armatimonadota bacterium]|nr:hypothetical protein [Armatimonadota bacterium]
MWVHNPPGCPTNVTVDATESDAQAMVDEMRGGRPTRPIYDVRSGDLRGEITTDEDPKLVIRYPHVDRGIPTPHWNVEDYATGINTHIRITP